MTDYELNPEAVEAAAIEICGHGKDAFYEYPYNERAREDFRAKARAALTAAAPLIAAEALDDAAEAAYLTRVAGYTLGLPVDAWLQQRARLARGEGS